VTKMLKRILGEDIVLQSRFAPDLPAIRVDVNMIEQILLNLAVNARDAMPHGGELTITSSVETVGQGPERLSGAAPGTYVCLDVRDTGCGIAPEHLPHIFEPFFTTKAVGKGTGLGLATVYAIVKQHQGWIEVKSEVGQGTAFRIYLPPAGTAPVGQKTAAAGAKLPTGTETILVVEDETSVRLLVTNQLQRWGYTVLNAATGVAALEVWKEHQAAIDLLLTDIIMPGGMTGRELAEKLRSEKPSLKVIYTSGYSTEILGKALTLTDGINFLQKPYQSAKLAHAVRKCMDEK
jgi:two-component system, cell cycle sensor histidine kinase and response regulator CckA